MTDGTVCVRDASPGDRSGFLRLWADFVAAVPGEPGNHRMGELNWSRIIDPGHGLRCIMALEDGVPCGFALFVAIPFTWSVGDACYLQDLYVDGHSRGRGIARAMIAHLRELGAAAGWFKIFWMTQAENAVAQRLYDKVARRMDYLRYDIQLGEG